MHALNQELNNWIHEGLLYCKKYFNNKSVMLNELLILLSFNNQRKYYNLIYAFAQSTHIQIIRRFDTDTITGVPV